MSFSVHTVVLVTPVVFALVKRGSFGSEDELPGVDVAAVGGVVHVPHPQPPDTAGVSLEGIDGVGSGQVRRGIKEHVEFGEKGV
jgi:hypothetical protein